MAIKTNCQIKRTDHPEESMYKSLAETRSAIESGEATIEGLTRYYLQQIADKSSLNAFLEVFEQDALNQAIAADEKRKQGKEAEKNAEHKLARMVKAPNIKRTQIAKDAVKKAELKNVPNAAAREASENSTQNYRDHKTVLPKK